MAEELLNISCPECGILFGFSKTLEGIWSKSHKQFYCPNGHTMAWRELSPKDKEHEALTKEVKELKKNLTSSLEEIKVLYKKIDDLTLELEIYKPTSVEKSA